MARRCVDLLGVARGWPVPTAVIWRAQMGATLDHFARDPDVRCRWIVATLLTPAARVFRNAARLRRISFVSLGIPIARPFPRIANHVMDAKAVRRKGRDW